MAMGQAAGTAAAQSVREGETANGPDTEKLRETLKENGAFLQDYTG